MMNLAVDPSSLSPSAVPAVSSSLQSRSGASTSQRSGRGGKSGVGVISVAGGMPPPSSLAEWQLQAVLHKARLTQYYETFIGQGGDDIDQIMQCDENEFLEIMALLEMSAKPLHVRRLQRTLNEFSLNRARFLINAVASIGLPPIELPSTSNATPTECLLTALQLLVPDFPAAAVTQPLISAHLGGGGGGGSGGTPLLLASPSIHQPQASSSSSLQQQQPHSASAPGGIQQLLLQQQQQQQQQQAIASPSPASAGGGGGGTTACSPSSPGGRLSTATASTTHRAHHKISSFSPSSSPTFLLGGGAGVSSSSSSSFLSSQERLLMDIIGAAAAQSAAAASISGGGGQSSRSHHQQQQQLLQQVGIAASQLGGVEEEVEGEVVVSGGIQQERATAETVGTTSTSAVAAAAAAASLITRRQPEELTVQQQQHRRRSSRVLRHGSRRESEASASIVGHSTASAAAMISLGTVTEPQLAAGTQQPLSTTHTTSHVAATSILSDIDAAKLAESARSVADTLPPIEARSLSTMSSSSVAGTSSSSRRKQESIVARTSKELAEALALPAESPLRLPLYRRLSAIYGRSDSARRKPADKPLSYHEALVNEAAAQLCLYRPELLTRRDELFPLARRIVREANFRAPYEPSSTLATTTGVGTTTTMALEIASSTRWENATERMEGVAAQPKRAETGEAGAMELEEGLRAEPGPAISQRRPQLGELSRGHQPRSGSSSHAYEEEKEEAEEQINIGESIESDGSSFSPSTLSTPTSSAASFSSKSKRRKKGGEASEPPEI